MIIYGGDVTAVGDSHGAGIGGGYGGESGKLTIYGGTVTATGGANAAAIGGGYRAPGGTVSICGGEVTAVSGGTSIGDGYAVEEGPCPSNAKVAISGGRVKWYSEMHGKSIRISGGIFNRRPYVDWLVPFPSILDNPAFETRTEYPYMVQPDPIPYLDWDVREKTLTNAVLRQWTEVTEETSEWGPDDWYVVLRDVGITNGVRVQGGAHLVLTDGATLTIPSAGDGVPGIDLSCGDGADGFLAIYGQTGGTGLLTATGGKNAAGIGGGDKCPGGSVTVNGGTVTAKCGVDDNFYSAGIRGKVTVAGTVDGVKVSGTSYAMAKAWRSTMTPASRSSPTPSAT